MAPDDRGRTARGGTLNDAAENVRPEPETLWYAVMRRGCQMMIDSRGQVASLRIEATRSGDAAQGLRLLDCLDRARAVAAEFGLRATVAYQKGRVTVTLRPRSVFRTLGN